MNIFKKMNMALCVYIVGLILLGYCRVGGVRDDLLFIIVNVLITVAVIIGMVMALVKIPFGRKRNEKTESAQQTHAAAGAFGALLCGVYDDREPVRDRGDSPRAFGLAFRRLCADGSVRRDDRQKNGTDHGFRKVSGSHCR